MKYLLNTIRTILFISAVVFISGCASTVQYTNVAKFPNQEVGLEDGSKARIYLYSRPFYSKLAVEVRKDHKIIGEVTGKRYLCWEQAPGPMHLSCKGNKLRTHNEDIHENIASLKINIKPGYVYYFEENIPVAGFKNPFKSTKGDLEDAYGPGAWLGGGRPLYEEVACQVTLKQVSGEEGADMIRKCKPPSLQ